MRSDNKKMSFDSNVDFKKICEASNCNEEQVNLQQCALDYADYLLETQKINIEYLVRNCNDNSMLSAFIDVLLKNKSNGTELLKQIASMLASIISEQPQILVPEYARSDYRNYEIDHYGRPLDIFTTNLTYYYCHADILLLIEKVYRLDILLFFSLLEKIKSKYLIQEFILRRMVNTPDGAKFLLDMIKNAPEVIESDLKTWNNKISVFMLLSTALEKLKIMWLKNEHDPEIKRLENDICDILCTRNDKAIILYSFSAYLIRMIYFPNTKLPAERKAYDDIASAFLELFKDNARFSCSMNDVSQYIRGTNLNITEEAISIFRATGKLSEFDDAISGFYPLLVFIALSPAQNDEMNETVIVCFENLLTYNDDFYYALSKNSGDLSCYHFYIASIYASLTNPLERWQKTRRLLNQLINRWRFKIFSTSSNGELNAITFFLHVGVALADILSSPEMESDRKIYQIICDQIWDDYKNLIISTNDAYWLDFHVTVTYLYIFMCRIIDLNNENDLNWLYERLSDFHSFPGLQIQILSNINLNGIDSTHKIRLYDSIKHEFDSAISSLAKYSELLALDKRKNRYEYTDRDINVYNAYLDEKH